MNILFAGTPEFSLPPLEALLDSVHRVKAVYTQPDRPAGRGRHLTAPPIKELAISHGIPVYQPETLRDATVQAELFSIEADVLVVVAYGLILPKEVLEHFKLGAINIHASLLPRWRGAAPIQRAILAGNSETGISIMKMEEGLDTGPVFLQKSISILEEETSQTLQDRLSKIGADLLLQVLEGLEQGKMKAVEQDDTKACYAKKIEKSEAEIHWDKTTVEIDRHIRAFNPWPVAFSFLDGLPIRIWSAQPLPQHDIKALPGTIIESSEKQLMVSTGQGCLKLLEMQWPGGRRLPVKEIVHAKSDQLRIGAQFQNKI